MNAKIDILIRGVDRKEWYGFLNYCKLNGTSGSQAIRDIVSRYVEKDGYDIQVETGINVK